MGIRFVWRAKSTKRWVDRRWWIYFATKLTRVTAGKNGEFLITWAGGAPTPSPCGTGVNWGWVLLPDNNQKDLALFAYLNEKPVRIDTSGCTGNFETVNFLFVGWGGRVAIDTCDLNWLIETWLLQVTARFFPRTRMEKTLRSLVTSEVSNETGGMHTPNVAVAE